MRRIATEESSLGVSSVLGHLRRSLVTSQQIPEVVHFAYVTNQKVTDFRYYSLKLLPKQAASAAINTAHVLY